MITPQKILDLSEPAEEIYQHIVDELLVNIGRHLRGNTTTWTAYWEIQKLDEMGQLTAENAAIINRYVEQMPDVLKDTMEETRKIALAKIEAQMKAAVASGHLTEPVADSSVVRMRDYLSQAADKFNATNTTMLASSLDVYQSAVLDISQRIMADEAAQLATGAKVRDQVFRETISRLADEGLTGFTDRAARNWAPEAYVSMVMRTTVHNTAIAATRARMEDYGTDVFQVSSHAGARPGCYPFQGKFYSWGGGSGEIELGNGKVVTYEPVSVTTYGEPAGLFGINCGHSPIPIIPGVTIPHGADNIQPEAANEKEYAESQQQRQLEREIREKKRVLEMLGDKATDADKAALTAAQAKMRAFTDATGRARRYDREKVYGGGRTTTAKQKTSTNTAKATKTVKTAAKQTAKSDAFSSDGVKKALGETHAKALNEKLDKAADKSIIKMFNNFRDRITIADSHATDGAYNAKDGVHFNIDAVAVSKERPPYQTVFHEVGHFIDMITAADKYNAPPRPSLTYSMAWNKGQLATDIRNDLAKFWKDNSGGQPLKNATRSNFATVVLKNFNTLKFSDCGALSDMYGFWRKVAYGFVGGHRLSYYRDNPEYVTTEFFAEMCECITVNPKEYDIMKAVFPTATSDFFKIVEEINNA